MTHSFHPHVQLYMQLNGFDLINEEKDLHILTFRKGRHAVIFWKDRIEHRIISSDKNEVSSVLKSFKGFNGIDIFKLMLILHLLDAVNLKDVRASIYSKLGVDAEESLNKEFHLFQTH